jgi:hypothetical protein
LALDWREEPDDVDLPLGYPILMRTELI